MSFSADDVRACIKKVRDDIGPAIHDVHPDAVRAVMSATASLLSARAWMMTAEALDRELRHLDSMSDGLVSNPVRDHLAAQGARIAALEQHISDLEKSLENARKERDEARTEARDALVGLLNIAEIITHDSTEPTIDAARRVVAERDAAVADNAALVLMLDAASRGHRFSFDPLPHPGAALLERVKRLEGAATKAAAELRHTYGHVALGQNINHDLVAMAISLLERAVSGH